MDAEIGFASEFRIIVFRCHPVSGVCREVGRKRNRKPALSEAEGDLRLPFHAPPIHHTMQRAWNHSAAESKMQENGGPPTPSGGLCHCAAVQRMLLRGAHMH